MTIELDGGDKVTVKEAKLKITIHAGRTENFFDGYRYSK